MTLDRALWVNALKRYSWHYRLPRDTFNPSAMTTEAIELAAARPYRFKAALLNEQTSFTSRRALSFAEDVGISENVNFILLIPGGRWLLTVHSMTTLACWDLSRVSDEEARPFAQLGYRMSFAEVQAQPDEDRMGAILLLPSR